MKLTISFKTLDAGEYDIREAAETVLEGRFDLTPEDRAYLVQERIEDLYVALTKWINYRERVTIEFDLAEGTATVLEQ